MDQLMLKLKNILGAIVKFSVNISVELLFDDIEYVINEKFILIN